MGFFSKLKSAFKKLAPYIAIVVMIVQPELAITIGTSMGFTGASAAAAGAATIQTTTSLAVGRTPEQAIKDGAIAGVTAGVGSSVATSTGSNVVGGATGSAAGTAAAGGSSQDILRNAVAGGVANGIADTGSASAGKAAGTLIATGGNVQAAIQAAVTTEIVQAGQQGYKDYSATKTAELNNINQSDTTTFEQQVASGAQQIVDTAKSTPGVQLAQADTETVSDTTPVLPEVLVTATQQLDPPLTFTGTQSPSAKPSTPSAVSAKDQKMLNLIKQPAAPASASPVTPTETMGTLPEVTVTATPEKEEPQTFTELPTITQADTTTPSASEPPPAEEKAAAKPSEEKLKRPMTYTGLTPLAQTLNTSFSGVPTTGATTGLTAERGAGEIETKETGKKRKNVWNEASLRLKDALGV